MSAEIVTPSALPPTANSGAASQLSDEKSPAASSFASGDAFDEDPIDHQKLLHRMDWKLLPYLVITYCIVRLDLGNISNAGILNQEHHHSLKQVLKLSSQEWAWSLACFYYPYAFVEPISTLFVKVTSPSIWLGRIMVSWGIVMICMAAVKSYAGLVVTRILLGTLEGGFFTGMVYHLSFWYTHEELVPRILALYMANAASGGVSGLLAYAISFADGRLYGWQWLFILEGSLPLFLGIGMFFILPDFPETSKWLTPREAAHITNHLHKGAPRSNGSNWDWGEIKRMFGDPTFFFFSLFWSLYAVGVWSISTVLPQVVSDMGITGSAGSNLLQIPPAATGILMCWLSSFLITRKYLSPFAAVLILIVWVIIAQALLLTVHPAGVRYFAACIVSGAAPTGYAILWPRRVASIRGTSASALGIGINNAFSQLTGIVGPQLYRTSYAPRYFQSFRASIALVGASAIAISVVWWLMEADLSQYPRIKARVQSQTQVRDEDALVSHAEKH